MNPQYSKQKQKSMHLVTTICKAKIPEKRWKPVTTRASGKSEEKMGWNFSLTEPQRGARNLLHDWHPA
jgi:hypothetical protein